MSKSLGQSWALQATISFLAPRQQISLSTLRKRIYERILPYLIPSVTLWEKTGHLLMTSTGGIKVFRGMEWVDVPLREKGSSREKEEKRQAEISEYMRG